jgi:hypothetical protein
MSSSESKIQKAQLHFQALTEIASSLNTASDELSNTVALLDESLKKLNLGLTVWVVFRGGTDPDDPNSYSQQEIGYCKVAGVWGVALRHVWGHQGFDEHHSDGPWLFNEASREMRISSVDKMPEVIEALAKHAFDTTKRVEAKTKEVRKLAEAISEITTPKVTSRAHVAGTPVKQLTTLAEVARQAMDINLKKDGGK